MAFIALFEKKWPSTGDLGLTAGMPRRTVVILAPVCEELLYRGAILRPIHDALIRRGRSALVARLLRAVFPDRTATGAAFGTAAGTSGDRTT